MNTSFAHPPRSLTLERMTASGRSHDKSSPSHGGFALIATISILVLLALIAVGLLSLSSIAIRSAGAEKARSGARANARLALLVALGELQKNAGNDRRITADGSILLADGEQPNAQAVGVWESWSPKMAQDPAASAPDYDANKKDRFLRWLVSGEESALSNLDWVKTAPPATDSVALFGEISDGFKLQATTVPVTGQRQDGTLAWAVTQENTKAKLTVPGPEKTNLVANDALQAQPRPNLELSDLFGQPKGEWNLRAARVVDLNQAKLDEDLGSGTATDTGGAHFTTASAGLLTNVVTGGLKTDLSLGFEMAESDFASESWGSGGESARNPFHREFEEEFTIPRDYEDQRPLYRPLSATGTLSHAEEFWPANVQFHFPVTSVPTFQSLRSFYRIPHHLYKTDGGITVFERENDHVAGKPGRLRRGYFEPPPATMDGEETQLGIRPVLDRAMFLISGGISQADELRIVLTPVITMWNPYNVALEIEGAVAHAWIDLPYEFEWKTFNARGRVATKESMYTSGLMGEQFRGQGHGRSVDPYFFAAITSDGNPLSASGKVDPIRFEPGEVRVFAPAEQSLVDFEVLGSIRERTVFLRPVDNISQFSTRGGFSIPTRNAVRNEGFTRKLAMGETAQLDFKAIPGEDYPFFISLEDATRAKGNDPSREDRGKAITDVLTKNFSRTGTTVTFSSPRVTYSQLKNNAIPIGVLEAFHRVARGGSDDQTADMVYTGNPRQPWMNPFITNTTFKTGPQYQSRMRAVSSFNGVLESASGGRSAYYGASHSSSGGRTHLSFFEVPQAPLLSLAGFQHGDFSATPFSPANQFANSWASAYVRRDKASNGAIEMDHCYLLNEALWDGWFFSGAAPSLSYGSKTGSAEVWENPVANVRIPLTSVLGDFFKDPRNRPLRNPRMQPARTHSDSEELVTSLLEPEGCLKIAGELMVDGAFNVNSTSIEAWSAMLAGLRGASFLVDEESTDAGNKTPFPRFRDPVGTAEDKWHGYRTLSDAEITNLATELVKEIRARGPFQSLAEFVNRRIADDDLGLKGALQAAIDQSGLNDAATEASFSTINYDPSSEANITPNDTAVGIPGYLTQADVLKPLASVITVRSDTFIIRAYGDSRDANGRILAKAVVEATVQRMPDFLDPENLAHTPVNDLNPINEHFGRRLQVVSFRYLSDSEIVN